MAGEHPPGAAQAAGGAATAGPAPAAVPGTARPGRAGLVLDGLRHRALMDGQLLDLTPAELRLLQALVAQPGRVYARGQLLERLHADGRDLSDRTVDSHIKNLRRKLQQPRPGWDPIRSVYGVGYAFEPDAG